MGGMGRGIIELGRAIQGLKRDGYHFAVS